MGVDIELHEAFNNADQIKIYNDGTVSEYGKDDVKFEKILNEFVCLINSAHEMPAFGVSLNCETLRAISNGLWLEFVFEEQYESNGMPFEKLLINVQKNLSGFNLIRYNSNCGYDGRCFYYDLINKNMDNLYALLSNL